MTQNTILEKVSSLWGASVETKRVSNGFSKKLSDGIWYWQKRKTCFFKNIKLQTACFSSQGELQAWATCHKYSLSWRISLWGLKSPLRVSDTEKHNKKKTKTSMFLLKFSWSSPEVLLIKDPPLKAIEVPQACLGLVKLLWLPDYCGCLELWTFCFSTILQLQGDPDRKLRINLLYTTIGGLGGVKKGFKVV